MPGANYMGGRRNSAKARSKDVTGRAQKGHFMRQKHQILARGLMNTGLDNNERHAAQSASIEDISFTHAKKDLQRGQTGETSKASVQRKTPAQILLPSSSPDSSKQRRFNNSKILEDLGINEPSGLKATLRRILRQPDLAGLSHANSRSRVSKRYEMPESTSDARKKRQRTCDKTSDSSSSPFRYDSPTRKGHSGRPRSLVEDQLEHLGSSPMDQQSSSDAHISTRSSSLLAEKGDTGNNSLSSSLGRFSSAQDVASNSSFADSGFSELQFSESDPSREYIHPQPDVTEVAPARAYARSSMVFSVDQDLARNVMLQAPKGQNLPNDIYSFNEGSPVHSEMDHLMRTNAPPSHDQNGVAESPVMRACQYQASGGQLESQSFLGSPIRNDAGLTTEAEEEQRYGVGYVPPNPNVKYKPFVPFTTMLPSYSDEDYIDITDRGYTINRTEPEEPMEVDEQTGDLLEDESQSDWGAPSANGLPSPISSSPYMRGQIGYRTPPRRCVSSPVRRLPAPHRSRSSLPAKHRVRSVLGTATAADIEDQNFPYYQGVVSSPRRKLSGPADTFKSLSLDLPRSANLMNYFENSLKPINESPLYQSPSLSPDDLPDTQDDVERSSRSPSAFNAVSAHSPVTLPLVTPDVVCALFDEHQEHPATDLASPMTVNDHTEPCSAEVPVARAECDFTSTPCDFENAVPRNVFDGPDLFADDADDDDD